MLSISQLTQSASLLYQISPNVRLSVTRWYCVETA